MSFYAEEKNGALGRLAASRLRLAWHRQGADRDGSP